MLCKEEATIRQHIAIEHQLKLQCEKLNEKINELKQNYEKKYENFQQKLNSWSKQKNNYIINEKNLKKKLEQKDKEIANLQNKLKHEKNNSSSNNIQSPNATKITSIFYSNHEKENINFLKNNTIMNSNNKTEKTSNINNQKNSNKKESFNNSLYSTNGKNNNNINNNINNILDYLQRQNSDFYNSPSSNRANTSSVKKENIAYNTYIQKKTPFQTKSKDSSPYSNNSINSQLLPNSKKTIEKFKLYKKISENKKLMNLKINEITRNKEKILKRTLSAFNKKKNSSPNIRRKKTVTPNKNMRQRGMISGINDSNDKNKNVTNYYQNNNYNINKTKTIDRNNYNKVNNYFRKKTPNRINQKKGNTPNIKYNNYYNNSNNSKKKKSNIVSNNSNKNNNNFFIAKNKDDINNIINNNISHILVNNINLKNKAGGGSNNSKQNNNHSTLLRKFVFTKCGPTNNGIYNNKY